MSDDEQQIALIVDPHELTLSQWHEVVEIAKEYVEKGETNVYRAAVFAFFDWLEDDNGYNQQH